MGDTDNMVDLTTETFEDVTDAEGIVIVDFWASWCGPCKAFAPVFEASAAENPDVTFAKVDTEAEYEIAAQVGIQSIPTLMAFRDGYLVAAQAGAMPKDRFDEMIAAVREADMDSIKAASAAELGT